MGAQRESARSRGGRSLVTPVLVMLLIRLAVGANNAQWRKAEITRQEVEAKAAQNAEREQVSEAAQAVLAQVTDGEAPEFALDDDVRVVDEVRSLTFSVPTAWGEPTWSNDEQVTFNPSAYNGDLMAGVAPDYCLAATSGPDAVRLISSVLKTLVCVGDASWSGTQGQAIWYRYPVRTAGGMSAGSFGFLEVILSGRDAYYLVTLCEASEYTTEIQDEMLCVLGSAVVPDEAPLFNDHEASGEIASDGTRRARDLAGQGSMADFLVSCGDFGTLELSGMGDDVVDIPRSTDALRRPVYSLITVTYEGTGRFVVKRVEEPGGEGVVLIDRMGPYHGVITNISNVAKTIQQDKLEVTAEGAWNISFAPLADVPVVENGATYTGDALVFMDEDVFTQVRCVHEGEGVFTVDAAGYDGSATLVNTTGPCDETVTWEDPHTLFVVHAEGDWSLSW